MTVLLYNSCFATFSPNNEESEQKIRPKKRLTKMIDLNADVLYLIFEQLETVVDILNLVEAHPTGIAQYVATSVFRQKYSNFSIEIYPDDDYKHMNIIKNTQFNVLIVYKFDLCLKMIKYIGNAIQQLEIRTVFIRQNESAIINEYVNKYVSESLKKFTLGVIKEDTFFHFSAPMKEIEDLSFKVRYIDSIRTDFLPMNELFPKLQRLTIDLTSDIDYEFLSCEFQHMEYLCLSISGCALKHTHDVEDLLRKNQQLNSIEIEECSPTLLKAIDELSPNVETIKLHRFDYGTETIIFNHVKNFIIGQYYYEAFKYLSFPRLESLEMNYLPEHHDVWKDFFRSHKHISRLHMKIFLEVDNAKLVELTSQLDDLTDMKLDCIFIKLETVQEIIRDHSSLTKFQLSFFSYLSKEDLDYLRRNYANEWYIEDYSGHYIEGLSFEKIE